MNRRNNFDLIRLLAAFQVMYSHSIGWLKLPPIPYAHGIISLFPGVAIFFVVSGFLVSGSFVYSGKSASDYFRSRALRIYPGLWLNLTVLLVLIAIGGNLRFGPGTAEFWQWVAITFSSGSDWIGNRIAVPVFRTPGFYPVFPSGVLWTIPVELSFYLLVPIIFTPLLHTKRHLGISLVFWIALSITLFSLIGQSGAPVFIGKYLWLFLIGAALRIFWDEGRFLIEGKILFWLPFYIASAWLAREFGLMVDYRSPTFSAIVLSAVLAIATISAAFSFRDLASLLRGNDLSYGVYLWHMPVIWTVAGFGLTSAWLYGLVAWAGVLLIAFASWRMIEKPAIRIRSRVRHA